jgi:hypothetical protein
MLLAGSLLRQGPPHAGDGNGQGLGDSAERLALTAKGNDSFGVNRGPGSPDVLADGSCVGDSSPHRSTIRSRSNCATAPMM